MSRPRRSLRFRAVATMVAALLVAAAVAALISVGTYRTVFERSARARSADVHAYFKEKLHATALYWEDWLMREKARLEFARLMENRATRWDQLRAYLASLSASTTYAGMVISSADGRELFRQGPETARHWPPPEPSRGEARTYFADNQGRLFVALTAPIWLGPDGMGAMHLIVPLDNAFLRGNAFPDTRLFIEWEGHIVAGSEGDGSLADAVAGFAGTLRHSDRRIEQIRMALPGSGEVPMLISQIRIASPVSVAESVGFGLAVFLVLALFLTAALHGWLMQLRPRIEGLGRAARLFAMAGEPSREMNETLAKSAGSDGDELSVVAHAMAEMMATIARRNQELLLSEKVFANSDQAILITDGTAAILMVNPAFCAITGYAREEVIGRNPRAFASGHHDAAFYAQMWGELSRSGSWAGEVWDRRKNGAVYPKWLTINAVTQPESGAVTHYVGIFSDITERKENEARIEHLAYHDPLTGLPNRYALQARLQQSLAEARRNERALAVMFIDLDRFKLINDSLGHDVGDQLLVAVARRIRHSLRESDTVARLGGDEFVIALPGVAGPEDAARVAEKVIAEVGEPLTLSGHTLHTSPSIGIALFPTDGQEADTLMKHADAAMYNAKQKGRNAYCFFTAGMNASTGERLLLESQLHAAIDRREFHLLYQPQMDLATGRVVGVEALVRWRHPDRGLLLPAEFIPIAEETGLIIPLGAWVLKEGCRQAVAWERAGLTPLRLAVNVSAQQFHDRNFARHVAETLQQTGLPAAQLELEITESAVMTSLDQVVEVTRMLDELGVQLAIDDFGVGYSSLAYLKRLPLRRLKIDRSFVTDLEVDPNDIAITEGIVALARSLGLAVTAEGIETGPQLRIVREFGCAEGQGYLFNGPLTAEAVAALLPAQTDTRELADASPREQMH